MDGVSYIKNLPSVWLSATLQEQHKIATAVLDAVYFDLVRQEIISIQPKAGFLPLLATASPAWRLPLVHGDPDGIRTHDLHRDRVAC